MSLPISLSLLCPPACALMYNFKFLLTSVFVQFDLSLGFYDHYWHLPVSPYLCSYFWRLWYFARPFCVLVLIYSWIIGDLAPGMLSWMCDLSLLSSAWRLHALITSAVGPPDCCRSLGDVILFWSICCSLLSTRVSYTLHLCLIECIR